MTELLAALAPSPAPLAALSLAVRAAIAAQRNLYAFGERLDPAAEAAGWEAIDALLDALDGELARVERPALRWR